MMTMMLLLELLWMCVAVHAQDSLPRTFVMGLPKSGSHAIHSFIQCMNAEDRPRSSAHYCCDPTRGIPASSSFPCPSPSVPCGSCMHDTLVKGSGNWSVDCGNYHVYAALAVETTRPYSYFLPQHFMLPYLVPSEGDHSVTWILNTRATPETWATHVAHWYSVTKRLFKAFGVSYYAGDRDTSKVYLPSPTVTTEQLQDALDISFERMHNRTDHIRRLEALADIYQNHTHKIQQFVQWYNRQDTKKQIQLYHVSVDDALAAPTILATALGYDTESTASVDRIRQCWTFNVTQFDADWQDFSIGPGTHW